ncbi:MAG: glycosyltransferase family 4 protein [Terracidiphilus sp.]|jgi:spore coat protein SA
MIYHVLTEQENFSEFEGGAISRWVANVLRDEPDTHIICQKADNSWGFERDRVHLLPGLHNYIRFRARRLYPAWLSGAILRNLGLPGIAELKPGDVLWVHGEPAIASALIHLKQSSRAKMVIHLHGAAFLTHNRGMLARLAATCDRLVFCSQFLESDAHRRFPELRRTTVLYNGADGRLFRPLGFAKANDPPLIVQASRMHPQKGVHVLLSAMRLLEERGIRAQARIYGAAFFGGSRVTPYLREVQRDAPANVHLAGYAYGEELASAIRSADVYCLPSTFEDPFPLAIPEAMASGLAVVASRAGGIPEAMETFGGLLVPKSDPIALADALQQLILAPEQRTAMGLRAREAYEKFFTWKAVRQGYREILETL